MGSVIDIGIGSVKGASLSTVNSIGAAIEGEGSRPHAFREQCLPECMVERVRAQPGALVARTGGQPGVERGLVGGREGAAGLARQPFQRLMIDIRHMVSCPPQRLV